MSGRSGSGTAEGSLRVLVLFGGTGGQTLRKLLPAPYGPHRHGRPPASWRVPWEAYERLLFVHRDRGGTDAGARVWRGRGPQA
ncbi:hypothetical protein [Streptomyces sp. NPDC056132]|uniref:hypothetical protein n=1 Tax=Streptomyces sp. NPDC056132 TaxID=3345722 RepID=UPI0035D88F6A